MRSPYVASSSQARHEAYVVIGLAALLTCALLLSTVAAGNMDVRWLRVGTIVMAVGFAMWLPAFGAAASAAGLYVLSAFLRSGGESLLRPDTLLETAVVAVIALLAVFVRTELRALATIGTALPQDRAGLSDAKTSELSEADGEAETGDRRYSAGSVPPAVGAANKEAAVAWKDSVRELFLPRTFAESRMVFLARLSFEMDETRIMIHTAERDRRMA
jgi:hypothetical protein